MLLEVGAPAPWFHCAVLNGRADYAFDSAAGRPIVMLVYGSGNWQRCAAALDLVKKHNHVFDDANASFFGVTIDPSDVSGRRIVQRLPGIRWFLDYDKKISQAFGAIDQVDGCERFNPHWLLLDSTLRVVKRAAIVDGEAIFAELAAMVDRGPEQTQAPVLIVPRVFEPALCRKLVSLYEQHGGRESGFMRDENGLTVGKRDPSFKRRSDYDIADVDLRAEILVRLRDRLAPQIAKAFQFKVTRIERWIVACYDSACGGFFRPHRDNTTAGTAHRNFACTINLNAEEYDGGGLRFPEFGRRTYRAPTGGAVIFSCSLLHEATAVTRGKRYAFLPFFYDDAGAALREKNQALLADGGSTYSASPVKQPLASSDQSSAC